MWCDIYTKYVYDATVCLSVVYAHFFLLAVQRLLTLIWLAVIVVIRSSAPLFRSWWHRCVLNYVYVSGNDYETNLSRWMLHFKWKLNWNERELLESLCECVFRWDFVYGSCISLMEKTASNSKIERTYSPWDVTRHTIYAHKLKTIKMYVNGNRKLSLKRSNCFFFSVHCSRVSFFRFFSSFVSVRVVSFFLFWVVLSTANSL